MAYKVLKHLNRTNKDNIEINNIEDQKWIKHYTNLWYTNSPQNNNDEQETEPEINEKQKSSWTRWIKF
jgi:hypothetical protein